MADGLRAGVEKASAVVGQSHSTCYTGQVTESLAEVAARCDAAVARARADLVHAIRRAAADGMTQARIAAESRRSQPEVHRLLHFHGTSPLARSLRRSAARIRRLVSDHGGRDVRVFGSVATGRDGPASDIDLLFTMGPPLSLMQLADLERRVGDIVGAKVDLVPDTAIRPEFKDRVLAEAVPL